MNINPKQLNNLKSKITKNENRVSKRINRQNSYKN